VNKEKDGNLEKVAELDYPQSPVNQTWIVDYPLLAYKTLSPMNREIAIINVAGNTP